MGKKRGWRTQAEADAAAVRLLHQMRLSVEMIAVLTNKQPDEVQAIVEQGGPEKTERRSHAYPRRPDETRGA